MFVASCFTSCSVHLLSRYTPPTTTGCDSRGCDIHTKAAMVRELALQSQCVRIDDSVSPAVWMLHVERETLRSGSHRDKLEAALAQQLGVAVRIDVVSGPAVDTPAVRNAAERDRRQREAEQLIQDDPVVRALMTQYSGARIVPGSVRFQ